MNPNIEEFHPLNNHPDVFDPHTYLQAHTPQWAQHAACKNQPHTMYPTTPTELAAALNLCAQCPVQKPCAEKGLTESHGIWGGINREPHPTQTIHKLLTQGGTWTTEQLAQQTGRTIAHTHTQLKKLAHTHPITTTTHPTTGEQTHTLN